VDVVASSFQRCCFGRAVGAIVPIDVVAKRGGRFRYKCKGRPTLLQLAAGLATIDDLHCYIELVELLQWHGRDVHSGHRRCYNATWDYNR
jgi:hypothetical protein